jgi:hypothetical protein
MRHHLPMSSVQTLKVVGEPKDLTPTQLRHLFITHLDQLAAGVTKEHRASAVAAQEAIAAMQQHEGVPTADLVARAAAALQSVQVRQAVYDGASADYTVAMRANFAAYFGNIFEHMSLSDPQVIDAIKTAVDARASVLQAARVDVYDSAPEDFDNVSAEESAQVPTAASGVNALLVSKRALRRAETAGTLFKLPRLHGL